jgi:EAL domain-containing protein (putative c-di-GMP-specific phosphodiesterase class I)
MGGVPHEMVIFELVETIVDGDNTQMSEAVSKLRDLGICIALDDFGIGHSTLHRLQSVDVDYVKVDRHFLEAARHSDRGKHMLQSIIDLIHTSGAAAIVEGIEDQCQLEMVRACGAAFGQGFFLGKPGPISAWDVSDPDHPVLVK